MTETTSKKITAISFVAICMVVILHAGAESFTWWLDLITQWAVPWFLLVSGYFFSRSIEKYDAITIIKKKVAGLLAPYFVWGVFGLLFLLPHYLSNGTMPSWLRVLGVTQSPLGNQPLWFVRSLVFSMSAILLLRSILSRMRLRGPFFQTGIVVIYAALFIAISRFHFFVEMPASPYYFLIGYVWAEWALDERIGVRVCAFRYPFCLAGVLLVVAMLIRWIFIGNNLWGVIPEVVVRNGTNLLMIPAIWMLVGGFVERHYAALKLPGVFSMSFFLYCFHMPVLKPVVRCWVDNFGVGLISRCFQIAVVSIIIIITGLGLGFAIKRVWPRAYGFICGGR